MITPALYYKFIFTKQILKSTSNHQKRFKNFLYFIIKSHNYIYGKTFDKSIKFIQQWELEFSYNEWLHDSFFPVSVFRSTLVVGFSHRNLFIACRLHDFTHHIQPFPLFKRFITATQGTYVTIFRLLVYEKCWCADLAQNLYLSPDAVNSSQLIHSVPHKQL